MNQEIALLDKLEAEHKEIMHDALNLEQITNDLDGTKGLEKASEDFVPWRIDRCKQIVQDLKVSLEMLDTKLSDHFDREEKDLLTLCQTHNNDTFGSVLFNLIIEHEEIRNRIAKSKLDVASLATDDLSPYIWQGRAYPVRFYLNNTRRRLQAHAENEQELVNALRRELGDNQSK
jgi:hypothetical protein